MADRSPKEVEFWLPSKFLSDNDAVFMAKAKEFKMLPTEFPYESTQLDSPVDESSAAETESSDDDDFFASLTRSFAHSTQKPKPEWAVAGSPQSTLSGVGSWSANGSPNGPSQVTSPPTTPFAGKDDTWDLIYAAAGQVARLKMTSQSQSQSHSHQHNLPKFTQLHNHGRGLLASPSFSNNLPQFGGVQEEMARGWLTQREMGQYYQFQQQIQSRVRSYSGVCGYENGATRCGGGARRPAHLLPRTAAWPVPIQSQGHNPARSGTGPGLVAGSGVKRECAGTGVFLPRRYSNPPPPEPRKKPTGCPNVLLPAKVVQALSMSFEEMNSTGHSHPRFGCGFSPDQEAAFVARRNALLEQQRRSLRQEGALNHEISLPQEWTY